MTSKYDRAITNSHGQTITVDVYDVLKAFDVKCPALQHLTKKALCAGLRGHKSMEQDLYDVWKSASRAITLHKPIDNFSERAEEILKKEAVVSENSMHKTSDDNLPKLSEDEIYFVTGSILDSQGEYIRKIDDEKGATVDDFVTVKSILFGWVTYIFTDQAGSDMQMTLEDFFNTFRKL